jgi:hypothetical protein
MTLHNICGNLTLMKYLSINISLGDRWHGFSAGSEIVAAASGRGMFSAPGCSGGVPAGEHQRRK